MGDVIIVGLYILVDAVELMDNGIEGVTKIVELVGVVISVVYCFWDVFPASKRSCLLIKLIVLQKSWTCLDHVSKASQSCFIYILIASLMHPEHVQTNASVINCMKVCNCSKWPF